MKTISIKKRLAAVTVLALAAGVTSAVSANAALPGITPWSNAGATVLVNDNSTTGAASTTASTGIISSSFVAQTATPATGVMLATGRLSLTVTTPTTSGATDVRDTLIITGGQVIGSDSVSVHGSSFAVNLDGTKVDLLTTGSGTVGDAVNLLIAPTVAAGGTITIQRYNNVGVTAFSGSSVLNFIANVSVTSSSLSGAVSTAKSWGYLASVSASPSAGGAKLTYDQADGFLAPDGFLGSIQFAVHDAYGNAPTAGFLQASSDNCVVGLNNNYSTVKSLTSAYSGDAAVAYQYLSIAPAVAHTATSCATTISFNGTVIVSKTIKFLGDIATLTVTSGGIQSVSSAAQNQAAGLLSIVAKDSAGNVVPAPDAVVDSGANAYVTTLDNTGYTQSDLARAANGKGEATAWVCGGQPGSASLVLKVTNAAYATIKSAPVTLACGAAQDTYTIATDKKTYSTGDIATVTITFKDANGGVANDVAPLDNNTVASGAWAGYVVAPSVTATPAASKNTSTNGVLTYKLIVGQTAGTFPVVVDVPAVDAAHGTAQTTTITVTSQATDSVSQLVKVVGTLLTSFTKQIAALIKALSKKK